MMKNVTATDSMSQDLEDPLNGMLFHEIRRAYGAIMLAMGRELDALNLNPSEATLLSFIGAHPGCTQSDIARVNGSSPPNLVPLIARLQRDGLLERAPGQGRMIALSLSTEGKVMASKVNACFERLEKGISRRLDPSVLTDAIEILRITRKDACHYDRE